MEVIIQCADIHEKRELHSILAQALSFPEYYGHNLDALYDQLTALSRRTHLIFEDWGSLSPAFRGFRVVLDHAEEENPNLTVTFR